MKKILAVVVAVGFSFAAYAGDVVKTTEKVKTPEGKEVIKTTVKGDETVTKINEKTKGVKEKITIDEKKGDTMVKDVAKYKVGETYKETVTLHKFEENGDFYYTLADNKVVRLKHKLSDSDKKIMKAKKPGDKVTVVSTYSLTNEQLAVIVDVE